MAEFLSCYVQKDFYAFPNSETLLELIDALLGEQRGQSAFPPESWSASPSIQTDQGNSLPATLGWASSLHFYDKCEDKSKLWRTFYRNSRLRNSLCQGNTARIRHSDRMRGNKLGLVIRWDLCFNPFSLGRVRQLDARESISVHIKSLWEAWGELKACL